jgi:predicted metal-dependent HD superfamily phosphohydrolase
VSKQSLIEALKERYAEPHRAYHNQTHIDAMLRWAHEVQTSIIDVEVFEWAVWYHDAIYEPMRSDNEEKSALLAIRDLTALGLQSSKIEQIAELINATKTHVVTNGSSDCALFLDVDMSILGIQPDVYKRYTELIRKEYKWVPSFLFNKNRGAMLQNWLARDVIFYTPVMRDQLESQARINLQNELSVMRGDKGVRQ